MCADSPMIRAKSPAVTLVSPDSNFSTRATNTSCGLDWGVRGCLLETEVKLDFGDVGEKAGSGHRKARPCGSQKESEGSLSLQRKRPCSLSSDWPVPSSDRVCLEEQEDSVLGAHVCSKRRLCSLGRPGLHPAASHAECEASPEQNGPKRNARLSGLRCVLGQEPPVQPRKVSSWKAHGRREQGELAGKKSRDPVLSSGQAPSARVLVRAASPDRLEVGQPRENDEATQAEVLIARLAREVRRLKKWKKRQLLPGLGEKLPLLSLQKPLCMKHSLGPLDITGQKPTVDVRQFFTFNCKNICHVTCSLCHTSIRQSKVKGQSQTSGLLRHLVSKHGLERERQPTAARPGEKGAGAEKKKTSLSLGSSGLAPEESPSPSRGSDDSPLGDGGGQPGPGGPRQLSLAPPPLPPPTPTKDEPTAPPVAVREEQDGTYAPNQPRAQAWNQSIAELLCSLALPLSFVSSPPFRRFMAQVDPCYHLPSLAFFADKALPLLHEAMDEQVLQEMQWAQGSCVHLTMSTAARDAVVDYVAITAHWAAVQPGSRQVVSGSPRRTAVLWVRGLPVESTQEERQRGLREKVSLWLSRSTMRPGFLVSGGCLSLEQAVRMEGYTHVPCFVSCLDSLVRNFLHHHHSIQIILGTARAICSHFQGSAEARRLLTQLQRQCGLPEHQPFGELAANWVSDYHLMEWLVEQQRPLQEYEEKHQLGKAGMALSAMFWSLTNSLLTLLQPFQLTIREASAARAALSEVLPQLRYLYIFLEQVPGHFGEQGGKEMGAAVRLAEGLALQLSTDCQLNELFHREELVLAILLDPRFKGKIEAILPAGADIDHWKQVLVYKVKEIMVSECPLPASLSLQSPKAVCVNATSRGSIARSLRAEGQGQKEPGQQSSSSGSLLLAQREKSLLEQLEHVGLLASRESGASLFTENHLASIVVKKYLHENETIGAQEDPLTYWEKRQEVWPALAKLATVYLTCPATGASSRRVFASLGSPALVGHNSPLPVETVEHLLFLKTNLENFPNYTRPPLVFPSGDLAEGEQSSESDLMVHGPQNLPVGTWQ